MAGRDPRSPDEGGAPDGEQGSGGDHYPDPAPRRRWERDHSRNGAEETTRPGTPSPPASHSEDGGDEPAAERFRRSTRARTRSIPDLPKRGYWGLAIGTVLFVMVLGGAGDYTDPLVRLPGHVVFWSLVSLGLLAAVHRERRNGWEPAARWPWLTAVVAGSGVAELLALTVASAVVITVSLILLGLGVFVLLLLD